MNVRIKLQCSCYMFVYGKSFHLGLMFPGKADYPVARAQYRSYSIAPGKSYITLAPGVNVTKLFFSANVVKLGKVIVLKVCQNFAS